MTARQRIVATYVAELDGAIRRHVELNPNFYSAAHDVEPETVARMLADAMGSGTAPYSDALDAMDRNGTIKRLMREVVRRSEDAFGVRHDHWAKAV
jgi:hypothetical protein